MNELKLLNKFQQALKDYHVSEAGKAVLGQTQLVLLLAASSTGRNTLIKQLVKTGDYHFIVSDTTRKPRANDGVMEQNGVEYWFRTEEEMLEDILNGGLLEAEIIHGQQVSGISIRELKKASDEQKVAITDIDIGGVQNIVAAKPDTIAIMVLPPTFEEWQRRIISRSKMPESELIRRVETASKVFAAALEKPYFHFVINDNLQQAAMEINNIVKQNKVDSEQQAHNRQLAEQILIQTRAYLRLQRDK